MGLIEDLGPGPIALDTAVFIYFIEEDPTYLPLVDKIFRAIDSGSLAAVTSTLTLLECLVVPIRAGNAQLRDLYESLLSQSKGLYLVDLDRPLLRRAAEVRALAGLKTPDALQVTAALQTGCSTFVTNDRQIPTLDDLRVIQLRDHL